jgi:hypothetical protein
MELLVHRIILVMACEAVIDWFKHFFISFFNNVEAHEYERSFYNRMLKENVAISLMHGMHYELVPDAK